jgi:hypothetical protein
VVRSFTVVVGSLQSIDFPSLPPRDLAGGSFTAVANASSGLGVVLNSLTPAVCTNAGVQIRLLSAGTCTLSAEQPGDAVWRPAEPVVRSFAVSAVPATPADEDVPLPVWALVLLSGGLVESLRRRASA